MIQQIPEVLLALLRTCPIAFGELSSLALTPFESIQPICHPNNQVFFKKRSKGGEMVFSIPLNVKKYTNRFRTDTSR